MLHTRIRFAALLFAACLLTSGGARSAQKDKVPPPKKVLDEKGLLADLKAKIEGRSPEEVRLVFDQLAQDWVALKGAAEVAYQRFTAQKEELKKARLRFAALPEPDTKPVPPVLRAADIDPAIKAAQQLAESQTARAQQLEVVVAATSELLKRAAEFDNVDWAARVHRERIKYALDYRAPLPEKLPEALDRKQLEADMARLNTLATDVKETREKSRDDLNGLEVALDKAKKASAAASARAEQLKSARESMVQAFEFEERILKGAQITDEFVKLRKTLAEKTAAIKGDADDFAKAAAPVAEARAKLAAVKEPPVPPETRPLGAPEPTAEATRQLTVAQQYLGARVRAADERAEKTAALVAALDEQEKKAVAYAKTLDDAREAGAQLAVVAAEIGRRVARGDLEAAKAPDGLAEAVSAAGTRAKLDADAAAVKKALADLRGERDLLRKPDPDADTLKGLTATVLAHVTARIDLLSDLKKLAVEYNTPRRERPESEQKRLDQRAAERATREGKQWDRFLALDRSKPSTDLSDLIDAYYKELVDLEEREDNLKRQREALTALVDETKKEADDIAKLRTVLEKRAAPSDEARKWDAWLAARLTPSGLKAESALYHDEQARLAVTGGANARRVQALTGNAAPEPGKPAADQAKQPVAGGEIAKAREDLFRARVQGLAITAIKIGLVLLAALIFPLLATRVLRRAIRGGADDAGNPSPVLSAVRRVLKVVARLTALAVILAILGFDVTALVVALAIGGLALAVAARPMIADVLGSLAVFADRRFKVGDVVRLGGGEPARVVGLTWRSTALRNTSGLTVSVPNRQLTESTVENLSRGTETYDTLAVTISTDKDAGRVISVIRAAMGQCKNLSADHGVTVVSYTQRGNVKVVQYRFWWFLKDYEARNKTRDEVFARIAVGLAHEDMTGIEVTLA